MSSRLFLLLSLIFSFLQGIFLPAVFAEGILLVFLCLQRPSLKIAPIVVLGGLFFDIVQNRELGVTSLCFLLFVLFFYLMRDQFPIQKAILLSLVSFLIVIIRWLLVFGFINWTSSFIGLIISFILLTIFWHPVTGGKIRI